MQNELNQTEDHIETDEIVDLEEYAQANRQPPHARRYRIRIDKQHFVVEAPCLAGRELLQLAGKTPPERYMISQKLHGGHVKPVGLDEEVDFSCPGVERFMTLPLDQTEG